MRLAVEKKENLRYLSRKESRKKRRKDDVCEIKCFCIFEIAAYVSVHHDRKGQTPSVEITCRAGRVNTPLHI